MPPPRTSPDRPPTRGARRREQTRARLLAAAQTLFGRQGVDATTINEITEEADVGFGSFYNHFASKEEIAEAALSEAIEVQGRVVDELTEGLDDPAEVVALAHRYFVEQARADPSLAWLLVRLDASHRVLLRVLGARARRDIRRGLSSGRFQVANIETAFADTAGALLMVMRAVLDGDLNANAGRQHAEAVLRILGVPVGEAAAVAARPLPRGRPRP